MDQMLQYWFMYKVGPIMLLMQQLLQFLHPQGQYKHLISI